MIKELFLAIDNKNAEAFSHFLADDCVFRFGNQQAVTGKNAIAQYVAGFFDSIKAVEHVLQDTWDLDGQTICHGYVTYTRHNDSKLKVPFANVLKMDDEKINEYLIFADTSALYAE